MHAGRLPSPFPRRYVALVAALGLGLSHLPGCRYPDGYDDAMTFPVRSDLLVATLISQTIPTGFSRPGHTPIDALKLPAAEVTADTNELRNELGKNVLMICKHHNTGFLKVVSSSENTSKHYNQHRTKPKIKFLAERPLETA